MELLGRRGVPVFNYDADELGCELETVRVFTTRAEKGAAEPR